MSDLNLYCIDASNDLTNWLDGFFTIGEIYVTSVGDMVNKIITAWQNSPDDIETLVIAGHGGPGFQSVGSGTAWDVTGAKSLQLDPGTPGALLGPAQGQLLRLRGMFTPTAVVSLVGCEVAGGPQGLGLLSAVSSALNVFVQAAKITQRPLVPGWEGNVYRCYRNTCWISSYGYLSD
jgi:hypothetical protein